MRPSLGILALAVAIGVRVAAQAPVRPSQENMGKIQEAIDKHAIEKGGEVAARARTTTGYLNADANRVIRRWDEAVRIWKTEKESGAAPLLAEGVLFDCLSRFEGVVTRLVGNERAVPFFADLAALRPGRAAKAFEAALKIDPHLQEARMRAARIRAGDSKNAAMVLERIANDGAAFPFSYLSAISRAETSRAGGALDEAARWYQRALDLNPRSTAATIGLHALSAVAPVPFDRLDASDIYYSYACTVLTPDVDAALATRVQRVVLK